MPRDGSSASWFWPFVAALLGTAVGSSTSIVVARQQMDASRQQTRVEFARDQRQSAYSRFLMDSGTMLTFAASIPRGRIRQSDCERVFQAFPAYSTLLADSGSIEIIGSDDARKSATAVVATFVLHTEEVPCGYIGLPVTTVVARLRDGGSSLYPARRAAFVDAAQRDLLAE